MSNQTDIPTASVDECAATATPVRAPGTSTRGPSRVSIMNTKEDEDDDKRSLTQSGKPKGKPSNTKPKGPSGGSGKSRGRGISSPASRSSSGGSSRGRSRSNSKSPPPQKGRNESRRSLSPSSNAPPRQTSAKGSTPRLTRASTSASATTSNAPRRGKAGTDSGAEQNKGKRPVTPVRGSYRRDSPNTRKRKARRAMQNTIVAEEKRRIEIEKEQESEWGGVMQQVSDLSFDPQRRLILLLQLEMRRVVKEFGDRATRAEGAAGMMLNETVRLIDKVHRTGAHVLQNSAMLAEEAPFTVDQVSASGETLECVRDPSSRLTEVHTPVRGWDPREGPEIERIRALFLDLSAPLVDGLAPGERVVDRVELVCRTTSEMAAAFESLLSRTDRQMTLARAMIQTQQRALDEGASRVQAADTLLRETTSKHHVEVDSAMLLCRQFGMELRDRMDAIEKEMRDTLSELIDRSTEVSIANNAFVDQAQLLINKENTAQWYMSKMETLVVEQGKLLRDVRLQLLQLWKERGGDGDEARATMTHSGLPKKYHKALEACDRDTLVRLLHYVSVNSGDAPELLVSALDEHAHFLSTNTEEAFAVAERGATEQAAVALLRKLREEGEIKLNPRLGSAPTFSDMITDMVKRYNAYMTASERRERRSLRQLSQQEVSSSRPFFDSRTPVPMEYAADLGKNKTSNRRWRLEREGTVRTTEASTIPLPQRGVEMRTSSSASAMGGERVLSSIPTAPKHFSAGALSGARVGVSQADTGGAASLPKIEVPQILSTLRLSHPSVPDPPGTATVVGFGRWGGLGVVGDNTLFPERTQNAMPTSSASTAFHGPSPPPGVPPRISMMRHLLEAHTHDVESALATPDGAIPILTNPHNFAKCFAGEDEPFLKLQRELFARTAE